MRDGWVKVWWVKPFLDLKRDVEMPRTCSPQTSVAIAVRMSLLWPAAPATLPEYIKPVVSDDISAFRRLHVEGIVRHIDKVCQDTWASMYGSQAV